MNRKINYIIGIVIVILAIAYFSLDTKLKNNAQHSIATVVGGSQYILTESSEAASKQRHGENIIANAYQNKLSNIQVEAAGKVVAILPDDIQGSRHQKFILELSNSQTVLVAHNIDLAPRVEHLGMGDIVDFYGEYEYSNKGGVIHWTHHDPRQRHPDGWLRHRGKIYQ